MLLAVHKSPAVPLRDISAQYFGLKPAIAARHARVNKLPVPAYRLATQKSQWLVSINDLAKYIDDTYAKARSEWSRAKV
jgi:hypothetical protein